MKNLYNKKQFIKLNEADTNLPLDKYKEELSDEVLSDVTKTPTKENPNQTPENPILTGATTDAQKKIEEFEKSKVDIKERIKSLEDMILNATKDTNIDKITLDNRLKQYNVAKLELTKQVEKFDELINTSRTQINTLKK
ncbi:hypothetical protein M0Q50_09190 [bacterium]|jgi:hypothetical protein|nr:hypothetical protein [bacterium]